MVECGGLENRLACIRSRGFESLLLRHFGCESSQEWELFCFESLTSKYGKEGGVRTRQGAKRKENAPVARF